jgi:hypothetical protein
MQGTAAEIVARLKELPDEVKLEIVDEILAQLDRPDPEIDRIWADEAGRRWNRFKSGGAVAIAYDSVMSRYKSK